MPLALIPFLLLAVPVTEITLFIMVGKSIGILPTIAIVLATAIAGSLLLRYQGISTLMAIRQEFNAGRVPGNELANGAMIVIAGLLLLTPG
ncbi:MAG: FxsA family protein, partial [Nitratireductor sp.]|nr:FxsA family protein [Nitratireductor sp.]